MKALSIRQPWAWLIVNGHKPIENRSWYCWYRGPLAIHAGKKFDDEGYDWVSCRFSDIKMPLKDDFQHGGIIGITSIDECVKDNQSEWFFGPWGFVLGAYPKIIDFIPMKGRLGLFEVDVPNEKEPEAVERRKIRLKMDLTNLMEFKKEVMG